MIFTLWSKIPPTEIEKLKKLVVTSEFWALFCWHSKITKALLISMALLFNLSMGPSIHVLGGSNFPFLVLASDNCTLNILSEFSSVILLREVILSCRMFYFFFESRGRRDDPVVLWLTGGPGCSSELALFYENGPFTIADNMSLIWNDYGWDKVQNGMAHNLFSAIFYFHLKRRGKYYTALKLHF